MNKQYSVDDILLEIKSKKSKQGAGSSLPAGFPIKKAETPAVSEPVQKAVAESVKESAPAEESFHFDLKDITKELPKEETMPAEARKEESPFQFKTSKTAENKSADVPPVKKQETFKVTIPDEKRDDLDYDKYFSNLKENSSGGFQFKNTEPVFTPEADPMEATREVSLGDVTATPQHTPIIPPVPEKPAKAPFKLNFNFDDDEETAPAATENKQKGLFPEEMLEEEPKGGFFRKKKAKIQEEEIPDDTEQDSAELDDYTSPQDKQAVIRDMRNIKIGLMIRFLLMLVVFAVSTYLALSATNPMLSLPSFIQPETNLRAFMVANTVIAGIGALICCNTVGGGLISLLKLKADSDALPSMAVIATLAQGVCFIVKPELLNMTFNSISESEYSISTAVSIFFPVAMLILLFNLIGKLMIILRIQNNFKMVASDRSKYSVNMMENKGLLKEWTANLEMEEYLVAYPVKTRFLSKFLEYSYSEDYAESMSAILAPVSILAAIVISLLAYFFNDNVAMAISTFAAVLCICTPLTSSIAANWPLLRLSNKLTPNGAMVAGYESVSKFADTEGIVVKASDIFLPENVTLHAIKAFDQSKIDSVIVDAASVVCSTKGMLSGVFTKIIGSDKSLLHPVDHIAYEDGMGLSAWVNGKRVLIGNRELMIHHGVEVPSMDYEKRYVKDSKNIIYLSNSGDLSAMFVISYNANGNVMEDLDKLADNGMFLIVETSDPNITAEKIHEAYDFPLEQLQIMPAKTNSQYRSMTEEQSSAPARIGFMGGAKTMIRAILDCMKVKAAISQSVVIQMAALIIGYGIIAVFSLVGDLGMLSFVHVLLYQLFWAILVLIVPNLKKL